MTIPATFFISAFVTTLSETVRNVWPVASALIKILQQYHGADDVWGVLNETKRLANVHSTFQDSVTQDLRGLLS